MNYWIRIQNMPYQETPLIRKLTRFTGAATLLALAILISTVAASAQGETSGCDGEGDFSPPTDGVGPPVQAASIIRAAKLGCEINARGTSIEGEGDFRGLQFLGPVDFSAAVFRGGATFEDAIFADRVTFRGARFEGDVNFSGVQFSHSEGLGNSQELQFLRTIDFFAAVFQGSATFEDATFAERVNFSRATFEGDAKFSGVHFSHSEDRGDFQELQFLGTVDFSNAVFAGKAEFINAIFASDVRFRSVTFEDEAFFMQVQFLHDGDYCPQTSNDDLQTAPRLTSEIMDFTGSTFLGGVVLSGTFRSCVVFRDADFLDLRVLGRYEKGFDFGGATVNGSFVMAAIERTNGETFRPPASVTGANNVKWRNVKGFRPLGEGLTDFYGQWENFFVTHGDFSSARQLRTDQRRSELRQIIYYLIASASILAVGFALIYMYIFRRVYRTSMMGRVFNVFFFSIDVLLPGIGPWKYDWKTRRGLPTDRVAVFTGIEAALGWGVLALGSAVAVAWLIA